MLGIVVFARCKSIEAASKTVYWGVEVNLIVVWENNVEVAIQFTGRDFMEMFGDDGKAD